MPAQAGIQQTAANLWIPAFAGMTSWVIIRDTPINLCGVSTSGAGGRNCGFFLYLRLFDYG